MFVKIETIHLIYEDSKAEANGADIDYKIILNDNSQLEGNTTIKNEPSICSWELWKFNKYIFEKIMKSL